MSPPVVLHVLEALGGGTARHLIDLVRHAEGVAHEVAVPRRRIGWLSDDSAVEELAAAGAVVRVVEMRRNPGHPRNALALGRLASLVRRRRPDIVHGHSSVGGALARAAAVGAGIPTVYTANGISPGRVSLAIERTLARVTSHFVAVSPSEATQVVAAGIFDADRVTVIRNGIDLESPGPPTLDLRERLSIPPQAPLVGSIGRLVPQKAPLVSLRAGMLAVRRHPEAHFVLVGSGILEPEVRQALSEAQPAERVHWLPEFPRPATVMGQLDVILSSSRFEGGPYVPLEAMRAGTPVVLTDAIGNRDAVVDGVSGLLAPVDDAEALAERVSRLLSDPSLAAKLVAAAAERLRAEFDVRQMGRAATDLYLRLMRR
jgi:glycosyltransferase involved in cell wall biosynthesis